MRVGIIGFGTLGRAIASGLHSHDGVRDVLTTRRGGDNRGLVQQSDVVLLCVKPYHMEGVAREIAPELNGRHILVTTAAGIGASQVRGWTGDTAAVVRTMPNMPVRSGAGMTVIARDDKTPDEAIRIAESLFSSIGRTVIMDEKLMAAATAISGCGPAYGYLIIEALTDAGIKLGIPYETSRLLVAQTLFGAARMVLDGKEHPAALKTEVTTPAGCTIDALLELEDGKLRSTLMRAVIAAARTAESLNER
jgi:pyrroline-5-carboxylate reductase